LKYGKVQGYKYLRKAWDQYRGIIEKKKLQTSLGDLEIRSNHQYVKDKKGPRKSPLLKEKLAYIGQLDTYRKGSEIAEKLLGLKTNATSIYRITDEVGEQCSKWLKENQSLIIEEDSTEEKVVNIEVDGSFILTKEEGWKEVKLGRVFLSSAEETSDNQEYMKNSEYLSHLGDHHKFREKMDRLISRRNISKTELVFRNDGASWIEKWIINTYPDSCIIP
jgi:hypothetical protein